MAEVVYQFKLEGEAQTLSFSEQLAFYAKAPLILFLEGALGAGKTTWVRGFLKGLQYTGRVKSPTYGLVESYNVQDKNVYHFDLYRLGHPEELEFMGIRDYLEDTALILIEWASQGGKYLPLPDIIVKLEPIPEGRMMTLQCLTARGQTLLEEFQQHAP